VKEIFTTFPRLEKKWEIESINEERSRRTIYLRAAEKTNSLTDLNLDLALLALQLRVLIFEVIAFEVIETDEHQRTG